MTRTGGSGKRKLAIKKIENKLHLKTTFTKRRQGLFKIVAAFCASSDTKAAVFTFSPHGRPYSYGSPSEVEVIAAFNTALNDNDNNHDVDSSETESEAEPVCQKCWWKKPAADIAFSKIDEFKEYLLVFKKDLILRIEDLKRRKSALLNLFV